MLRGEHFEAMKDGAIIANTGHFDVEIDIPALEKLSATSAPSRDSVEEFTMADGRSVYLLGEGGWSTSPPPRATRRRSWT